MDKRTEITGWRLRLLNSGLGPSWVRKNRWIGWRLVTDMEDATVFPIRADCDEFMRKHCPRRDFTIYQQELTIAPFCDVQIKCVPKYRDEKQ